jgi:hypothetical protein
MRLGRRACAAPGCRHRQVRRNLRRLIQQMIPRGRIVLDFFQRLHRLDVVRGAPGVLALQAIVVLRLRSASRVLRFSDSVFWLRTASSAAMSSCRYLKSGAVGGALIVQLLQRGGDRLQVAFDLERGRLDVIPGQGAVAGALADFVGVDERGQGDVGVTPRS